MPADDHNTGRPHLIVDQQLVTDNSWQLHAKDNETLPAKGFIAPLTVWKSHRTELIAQGQCAVWLDSDEPPSLLEDKVSQFDLIAINFPVFADGRGYSYARSLRVDYGFEGELRAVGDVLPDQLLYMQRCGFNAFELRGDRDPEAALLRFTDFSEYYQSTVSHPLPLFARRN